MAISWSGWYWRLGLVSLSAMGGVLAHGGGLSPIASKGDYALAQVIPDGTLPNNSILTPQGNTSLISGGTQAGSNLFHSFEQFSVPTGGEAFFNNALDIQNIISRVTGSSISNIDGLIRANGTANLFLLNPNGIAFGSNARLSIGGSFIGSTANSLNFADGTQFSATAPTTTPLLTVSVPIGLQYGGAAGGIQVQGNGQGTRTTTDLIDTTVGLRVEPNQTLALVGGDIALSGGTLKTAGGRIELGSVAGAGRVNLTPTNTGWALSYEGVPTFGDIQLSGAATVDASGAGGGDIQVQGRRVTLTNGSQIEASTLGAEPGGTLTVRALESVELIGTSADGFPSGLFAQVYPGATGSGGNLTLETGRLIVRDGAQVSASAFGSGNAGSVNINARDTVSFDGGGAFSTVEFGAVGNGGGINITTGSLALTNGARLTASNLGIGDAGNVIINARDRVSFTGTSADERFRSVAATIVSGPGSGKGGDVRISTGSLEVTNGAGLIASTYGQGNAGNVIIEARDRVSFTGTNANGQFSCVCSTVEENSSGKGGDIRISTGSLEVTGGARLTASTLGIGDAGNVIINARDRVSFTGTSADGRFRSVAATIVSDPGSGKGGDVRISTGSLEVTDGANLAASTLGIGDAGNVIIEARDRVSFTGTSADGLFPGGAESSVYAIGSGKGGDVRISTGSLEVTNGAELSAFTLGTGDAGNIQITATDSVNIAGTTPLTGRSSALFTFTRTNGTGGDITVNTNAFRLSDGAVLNASTFADGNSGNITVTAPTIDLAQGGQLLAITQSNGRAGSITANATNQVAIVGIDPTYTDRLSQFGANIAPVTANSGIFVRSQNSGGAGDITVNTPRLALKDQGSISAESNAVDGGNINLTLSDFLLLRRNSSISATAGQDQGAGNGGNITINANNGFLVAVPSENGDITANAFSGSGGRVDITAQGVFGLTPLSRQELQTLLEPDNPLNPIRLPSNDITAISQTTPSLSGFVTFNVPDVDPSQGLIELPAELVDVSNQIATDCPASVRRGESKFIITGRGGLPPNPREPLSGDNVLTEWSTLDSDDDNRSSAAPATNSTTLSANNQIVEANGWMVNDKGEVVLTAQAPTATLDIPWLPSSDCHAPEPES